MLLCIFTRWPADIPGWLVHAPSQHTASWRPCQRLHRLNEVPLGFPWGLFLTFTQLNKVPQINQVMVHSVTYSTVIKHTRTLDARQDSGWTWGDRQGSALVPRTLPGHSGKQFLFQGLNVGRRARSERFTVFCDG